MSAGLVGEPNEEIFVGEDLGQFVHLKCQKDKTWKCGIVCSCSALIMLQKCGVVCVSHSTRPECTQQQLMRSPVKSTSDGFLCVVLSYRLNVHIMARFEGFQYVRWKASVE